MVHLYTPEPVPIKVTNPHYTWKVGRGESFGYPVWEGVFNCIKNQTHHEPQPKPIFLVHAHPYCRLLWETGHCGKQDNGLLL